MIKGIKKLALAGMLTIAGGIYNSGGTIEDYPKQSDYNEKLNNFLGKQSEIFITSDLEKRVREERESFIEEIKKPLYLSTNQLNTYIKQAQKAVGKLPKEIDERLFRLMLKQESGRMIKKELRYNAHAVSRTGYMGVGQVGYDVYKTFRPEKWESFRDSTTGQIDTLSVKKELFDPRINLELSIQSLKFFANYCKKNDPNWEASDLETRKAKVLTCYNAGQGNLEKANWNPESKKLKEENRNYPKVILAAYHNPSVKVKI